MIHRELQPKIVIRLINEERKEKRLLSARACLVVYDYCPGTTSDWGMCSVGAQDRCTAFDWGNCGENAIDICKYDYGDCPANFTDICIESDYATCNGSNNSDYCYPSDYS